VAIRVGWHEGTTMYLDLHNEKGEFVALNADGWKVVSESPVHFIGGYRMKPLPYPQEGDISDLLGLFPVEPCSKEAERLVRWLMWQLCRDDPYQHLFIQGPPGTGKSCLTRVLKNLVDPNIIEYTHFSTNVRNLVLRAHLVD
jgi:hypothetical protein